MSKTVEFVINRKMLLNSNIKYHYRDRGNRARMIRDYAKKVGLENPSSFQYYTIEVVVCPPTNRRLDPINLYPTVKPIIDGLTDAEYWPDDDFVHLQKVSFVYGGKNNISKTDFIIRLIINEIESEEDFVHKDVIKTINGD